MSDMVTSPSGAPAAARVAPKPTNVRWFMALLTCLATFINYLDRVNISVAAPVMAKDLHLNPAMLGVVFSVWGWALVCGQIPMGMFIDRFGTRLVYGLTILLWSGATFVTGLARSVTALIGCRAALGFFETTQKPANIRITAAWFPAKDRGKAVGQYVTFEYVGQAFCLPLLAWFVLHYGWHSIFYITGTTGILFAFVWWAFYRDPTQHKGVNQAELDYIRQDEKIAKGPKVENRKVTRSAVKNLFSHRLLWGMYLGQFSLGSTFYFFALWVPSYLVTAKHMTLLKTGIYAGLPYFGALLGAQFGSRWTSWLITKGYSLGAARRIPVIFGSLASTLIFTCNYIDNINLVGVILTLVLFGQSIGVTVTWTMMADVAPKGLIGFYSGVLNFFAVVGAASTPLIVGLIVHATNSFVTALVFVAGNALLSGIGYAFIIRRVYRIEVID